MIEPPSDLTAAVRHARRVAVLTGAGVSADSGIATFRDALTGLWARYDPQQLATPEAYEEDPELVTRWYDERRRQILTCRPNPGHVALATWQQAVTMRGGDFTLVTQNVDGLHQMAGSSDVTELHGNLRDWRCVRCGDRQTFGPTSLDKYPPQCECGGTLRPDVVWFGESLPPAALGRAERAALACDLFVSVGTSSVVYPAAGLIESAADRAQVIEINPQPTAVSHRATWAVRATAAAALPALVRAAFADA